MNVREVVIRNIGGTESFGTHHLIVFAYTGDLAPLAATEGKVVDDTACSQLRRGKSANLHIVATSQGGPDARADAARHGAPSRSGRARARKQAVGLV
jgi:hypothetical protein